MGENNSITQSIVENHVQALGDVIDNLLKRMRSAQGKEKWGKRIIVVIGILVGLVGLVAGLLGKDNDFQQISVWITAVLGFATTATTTLLDPDKRDKTAKDCQDFIVELRILRLDTQRKLPTFKSDEEFSSLLDDTLRPEEKRIFAKAREAGLDEVSGIFDSSLRKIEQQ